MRRPALATVTRSLHYVVIAALLAGLPAALRFAGLPLRWDWPGYVIAWGLVAAPSIAMAAVVYQLLKRRDPGAAGYRRGSYGALFAIAAYQFLTFVVIFGYNDVIARLRFTGGADAALNRIDSVLLLGNTIGSLTGFMERSPFLQRATSAIYGAMLMQVGATWLLLWATEGTRRAASFVGAIVTAYLVVLGVFWFVPATGPWFRAPFRSEFAISTVQHSVGTLMQGYLDGRAPDRLGCDYLMAFPCLHFIQPLIVLWFVRRWKRIFQVLVAFDAVLTPSIVLLRQHYVVDLLTGFLVAAIAVAMVDGPALRAAMRRPAEEPAPVPASS